MTTTRNVVGNPLVEFILAGGNRQIEHHLFPKMARNKLPTAAQIVREFCAKRGISYKATSFSAGIQDVYRGLSRCAAAARVNAPQLRAALQPAPAAG